MKTVRIVAVWLLMLALPLQGLAAIAASVDCIGSDSKQAAHAVHDKHQSHHAASQAHEHPADNQQQDDGQPVDQASTHSCCHQVFTSAPSTTIPGIPAPPNTVIQRVSLLATLHIPEQPQRPPRA